MAATMRDYEVAPTPCWCGGSAHGLKAVIYRLQCAAMAHGCLSALAIDGPPNIDVYDLDRLVREDRRLGDLLRASGWWLDHGQWVCGNHPRFTAGAPVRVDYTAGATAKEMERARQAVLESVAEALSGERPDADPA